MTQEQIKLEDVVKTYNGKPGCACGCRGQYTERGEISAAVKRRVAFINKNMDHADVLHWTGRSCYEVENETGTRVTRVYVRT